MIICAECGREMKVEEVGMRAGKTFARSLERKDVYKVYNADLLVCPACGHAILNTANQPFAATPHEIDGIHIDYYF